MPSTFNIAVFGSGGVGKSALTIQFVLGSYVEKYDPTIEDSYRKLVNVGDGEYSMLEILDTAGTDQFQSVRDWYMQKKDGYVIVYSIGERFTFEHMKETRDDILRCNHQRVVEDGVNLPIVIIGNKSDLPKEQRKISFQEGFEYAQSNNCLFFETSAKLGENIQEPFEELVQTMITCDKMEKKRSRRKRHPSKCLLI